MLANNINKKLRQSELLFQERARPERLVTCLGPSDAESAVKGSDL